jgi:hypothetical protein
MVDKRMEERTMKRVTITLKVPMPDWRLKANLGVLWAWNRTYRTARNRLRVWRMLQDRRNNVLVKY